MEDFLIYPSKKAVMKGKCISLFFMILDVVFFTKVTTLSVKKPRLIIYQIKKVFIEFTSNISNSNQLISSGKILAVCKSSVDAFNKISSDNVSFIAFNKLLISHRILNKIACKEPV